MPGFDRTGPGGKGPMTGGGRGLCASQNRGGIWPGRGYGMGFGRGQGQARGRRLGRCWREPDYRISHTYKTPAGAEWDIDILHSKAQDIREELKDIEARISGFEKKEN